MCGNRNQNFILIILVSVFSVIESTSTYNCKKIVASLERHLDHLEKDETRFRTSLAPKVKIALEKFQAGDLVALDLLITELNDSQTSSVWISRLNLPWDEIILSLRHGKTWEAGLANEQSPSVENLQIRKRLTLLAKIRSLFIERTTSKDVRSRGDWIKWHRLTMQLRASDQAEIGLESQIALNAQAASNALFKKYFADAKNVTNAIISVENTLRAVPLGKIYVQLEAMRRLSPNETLPEASFCLIKSILPPSSLMRLNLPSGRIT